MPTAKALGISLGGSETEDATLWLYADSHFDAVIDVPVYPVCRRPLYADGIMVVCRGSRSLRPKDVGIHYADGFCGMPTAFLPMPTASGRRHIGSFL